MNTKLALFDFLAILGVSSLCFYAAIDCRNSLVIEREKASKKKQKEIDSCKEPMLFKTDTFDSTHTLYSYVCQDSNVLILSKPILGAKISPYLK